MEQYTKLCRELIEEHIKDTTADSLAIGETIGREQILNDLLEDTQNVFGNIDGSRTYSTYKAQQFIDMSGAIWDDDIHQLFDDYDDDYFFQQLKKGAEALDVTILELLAPQVISEMLEEGEQ